MPQGQDPSDAFGRQLPENCVEYFLFLADAETDASRRLLELEALRKAAVELAQTLTKDYIWQRDDFQLEPKVENGLHYLYGVTDYGDAVEDEWLIVYILRELTKSYPTLWARVVDSDGEFLLIEAANVLPRWLSPEMDRNRVWIHDEKLFVIPPEDNAIGPRQPQNVSLPQAVNFFRQKPDCLVHSSIVQAEAFYRLNKYPGQVVDSAHHSLLTIPRKLAFILRSLPKSVSPAVEAFYLRDPFALKPILSASGPLVFPPEDLVTTSVRFSRCLFAQLKSQRFEPPPRWQKVLQASSSSSPTSNGSTARLELGMKLTCGFEMLAVDADKSKRRVVRQVAIMLQDLAEDGDAALPTDGEMGLSQDCHRDDDEAWMDINYEDFERELDGKEHHGADKTKSGFGDAQTQADLRKIVSRFEAFLNDEKAGLDGAELDDMDMDSHGDHGGPEGEPDEEDSSESEDRDVELDEQVFSQTVRELLGLPLTDSRAPSADAKGDGQAPVGGAEPSTRDEEDSQIQELSLRMEAELERHGALKVGARTDRRPALPGNGKGTDMEQRQAGRGTVVERVGQDHNDEEVEVDYNLARNLLESFKSQGGLSGPTGNLLGIMGFQLPRDEDGGHNDDGGA